MIHYTQLIWEEVFFIWISNWKCCCNIYDRYCTSILNGAVIFLTSVQDYCQVSVSSIRSTFMTETTMFLTCTACCNDIASPISLENSELCILGYRTVCTIRLYTRQPNSLNQNLVNHSFGK